MKVLQVLYSGLGGHGAVAFALHKASAEAGHWTDSMLFVGVEPVLPWYERICARDDMEYSSVRTRAGRPWASWISVWRRLRKHQPDAILLHSVKLIFPCWLYCRSKGIPLVAVEHQQNALKTGAEWMISRLLMLMSDQVIVLTEEYLTDLEQELGRWFNRKKVTVIANGIDVRFFTPRKESDEPARNEIVMGMAARFSSTKHQSLLVDVLKKLRESGRAGDWRLVLAGDGERLESVRRRVDELGMTDLVGFSGTLDEDELRAWFHDLDVYVHATEGETLSTSLLQAMAAGLPIVASDVPGVSRLIGGAEPVGLLVANDEPGHFAQALETLAADPALRKRLAHRATRRAVEKYSHLLMYQKYSRVLDACQK
ncbi:glycosyltransferase family 4 protein [Thiolapillus sp.]